MNNLGKLPWQLWSGALLIVVGMAVAVPASLSMNTMIMFLGVVLVLPGVYLAYTGWGKRNDYATGPKVDKHNLDADGKLLPPPNTLIVRPFSLDQEYLPPEYIEDFPINAIIRKVHKSNKKFYLLEQRSAVEVKELRDLVLPDDDLNDIYYQPKEFGNAVTMPSNKRYFEWSATTFQKIAIGLMVLVIIIEIIGLAILGGE